MTLKGGKEGRSKKSRGLGSILYVSSVTLEKILIPEWTEGDYFPYATAIKGNANKIYLSSVSIINAFAMRPELHSPFFCGNFPVLLQEAADEINDIMVKDGLAKDPPEQWNELSMHDIKERYVRLTLNYRKSIENYTRCEYHNLLNFANKYLFEEQFILYDSRASHRVGQVDSITISFKDYLAEIKVTKKAQESANENVDELDNDGEENSMPFERAINMSFDASEEIYEAKQAPAHENEIVLEPIDVAFLQDFLSLNEQTKDEIRLYVSSLAKPKVLVEKILKSI